jgi:hypothetical protein
LAVTVGLVSTTIGAHDLRRSGTRSAAFVAPFDAHPVVQLVSPPVCQPPAERLHAIDTLLQAAVDAARDVQDDLAAHDPGSASVALRYLRTYIQEAESTESCGIDRRPADTQSRDV